MLNFIKGHWYVFQDREQEHKGYYIGRQRGFECCVCGKGGNAYTFNIWHSSMDYETWGYGKEHLPKLIIDLGALPDILIDTQNVKTEVLP